MTDDTEDREFVELERNSMDEVGAQATEKLSYSTKHTAASFVVRAGLGPLLLSAAGPDGDKSLDATPEEVGALLAVSFKPDHDPIHEAVANYVRECSHEGVVLAPEEAREIADHLADYDIVARTSSKEEDRPVEAVEWSRELRERAREARDE